MLVKLKVCCFYNDLSCRCSPFVLIRIVLSTRLIYTSHDPFKYIPNEILGGVPNTWKQRDGLNERFSTDDDGINKFYSSLCSLVYVLEMQQYGSTPYCILPLSVLQYIAILQYLTSCI